MSCKYLVRYMPLNTHNDGTATRVKKTDDWLFHSCFSVATSNHSKSIGWWGKHRGVEFNDGATDGFPSHSAGLFGATPICTADNLEIVDSLAFVLGSQLAVMAEGFHCVLNNADNFNLFFPLHVLLLSPTLQSEFGGYIGRSHFSRMTKV